MNNNYSKSLVLSYHIVFTTHNSRTSSRMIKYNVRKGPERRLSLEEEIILTNIIGKTIIKNQWRCIAYNICNDHVHLILVCEQDSLTKIVQKLKSISSKLFHRHPAVSKRVTALHNNHLWSQKFFRARLNDWTLSSLSKIPVWCINHPILPMPKCTLFAIGRNMVLKYLKNYKVSLMDL